MRMKTLFAVCSALSLAGALTVAAPAGAQGRGYDNHGGDRGGDHGGGDRGGDRGGDHRGNNGNVVAAGVLGVVLGAAIADSANHRAYYQQHAQDNDYHGRCAARYHSYDRDSGTYLGRDGHRHYCRL
jgi:hypothetical protein